MTTYFAHHLYLLDNIDLFVVYLQHLILAFKERKKKGKTSLSFWPLIALGKIINFQQTTLMVELI